MIPVVVPDPDSVDGDDVFRDSAFKPIWDVIRALKAHDFRLEVELNRLRGLTALGPVAYKEFLEATHLRILGIDDLAHFDRYAPMRGQESDVPFSKARGMVLDAFRDFHPDLAETAAALTATLHAGRRGATPFSRSISKALTAKQSIA